jgi:hypothetical protein
MGVVSGETPQDPWSHHTHCTDVEAEVQRWEGTG